MRNRHERYGHQDGYALFVVIVVILTISTLLGVMHSVGVQRAFMAHKLSNRAQALATAENGLARVYTVLAADFNSRTNPAAFPPGVEGNGTYTATVTPISNNTAVVRVSGTVEGETVDVIVDVLQFKEGQDVYTTWDPDPFRTLIFAGKSMKWKAKSKKAGELNVINGRLHANKKVTIEGDNVSIAADITSSGKVELKKKCTVVGDVTAAEITIGSDCRITGTSTEAVVPYMSVPQIDLTPYYAEALRNGQVITGDLKIKKGEVVNINPPGGILWVNGKVDIQGDGVINGCIISTGDLKIKGTVTQTKYGEYPALVSRDKKIEINGNGTFHGLVYAPKGDVKFKKSKKDVLADNGSFTGSIVAGKNVHAEGGWSFMFQEDSSPDYPDGSEFQSTWDVVYVAAWQQ